MAPADLSSLRPPTLVLALLAVLANAASVGAYCDRVFATRVGPPAMAQPDGNIQTFSGNCTGTAGCSDYFDVNLQENDPALLTVCMDGGSSSFPVEVSVWVGQLFDQMIGCEVIDCLGQTDMLVDGYLNGPHRIRIGNANGLVNPAPDGAYTLAYSIPEGRSIVQSSCGNGTLDAGEQCDDGNAVDGDCCSSACALETVGTECGTDGNDCTDDQCDGAGTCVHPSASAGSPCVGDTVFCTDDVCDGAGTCTHPAVAACNPLPACNAPQPSYPGFYSHPSKAKAFSSTLVQAFVACANPGGNVPNTTTESGTVPACFPAETLNEQAGAPGGAWYWDPSRGSGTVDLKIRCPHSSDLSLKLKISGIVDANGDPANGTGKVALLSRFVMPDSTGGVRQTIDVPLIATMTAVNGVVKFQTSVNAIFSENGEPPLPNGTAMFFSSADTAIGAFIAVIDPNGTTFAVPGIFLP